MKITVVIPTYNPDYKRLEKALAALYGQTLPMNQWEVIIVDNASTNDTLARLSPKLRANTRIVNEAKQGLTFARLKGFNEATNPLIVMVDDDNVLKSDYLELVVKFFKVLPQVGMIGGKSLPVYEKTPPGWFENVGIHLGCRDLGDKLYVSDFHKHQIKKDFSEYPSFAPIGTGMCLRKEVSELYSCRVLGEATSITDRRGSSLSSGGDNDIVLTGVKAGWELAYIPHLVVEHLIPASRLEKDYLVRMNYDSSKSWVSLLDKHGIRPWPAIPAWSKVLRQLKAYLKMRAWQNNVNYILWKGICGRIEGQCELKA